MRYPAPEKLEIIRLVEGSHLPTKRMLDKLGIPRTTFYRWHDRYLASGPEALEDRSPSPSRVWNRVPEPVREKIKNLALKESDRFCRKVGRPPINSPASAALTPQGLHKPRTGIRCRAVPS